MNGTPKTPRPRFWLMLVVGLALTAPVFALTEHDGQDFTPTPDMRPFVKGSLTEITEAKSGAPYLLVFWSMYCAPCVAEMETWHHLLQTRDDFDIVMVATDPIAKTDKLNDILGREGLPGVERWAFADDMVARVRFDVDPKWRGELPRIHFVDAEGRHTPVIGRVGAARVTDWLNAQGG